MSTRLAKQTAVWMQGKTFVTQESELFENLTIKSLKTTRLSQRLFRDALGKAIPLWHNPFVSHRFVELEKVKEVKKEVELNVKKAKFYEQVKVRLITRLTFIKLENLIAKLGESSLSSKLSLWLWKLEKNCAEFRRGAQVEEKWVEEREGRDKEKGSYEEEEGYSRLKDEFA